MMTVKRLEKRDPMGKQYAAVGVLSGVVIQTFYHRADCFDYVEHANKMEIKEARA